MSLSGVIDSFATGTYTVTRSSGAGSYSGGDYTPGATSAISVKALIQPVTGSQIAGRDIRVLAEGQHSVNLRMMYSKVVMKTRTPTTDPDIISIDSENWEVKAVERWQAFGGGSGGSHYKSLISRIVTP